MSGMNEFLAQYYGTGSESSQVANEDTEKQAQLQLFVKMAAENNVDLSSLTDEQAVQLFATFQKVASEDSSKDEGDKSEKVEKAKEEHEEKKAAAEKLSEADFLGRVMAHSYVDELKKIAAAQEGSAATESETPADEKIATDFKRMVKAMDHQRPKDHVRHAKDAISGAAGRAKELFSGSKLKEHKDKLKGMGGHEHMTSGAAQKDKVKSEAKKVMGARVGAGAAAGAAAAGGAAAFGKKKESSALDELAGELAVEKAAAANFDVDEAASRIAAVLILGPSDETSKIASAPDLDGALEVRSLELLELAGYPVTWGQQ